MLIVKNYASCKHCIGSLNLSQSSVVTSFTYYTFSYLKLKATHFYSMYLRVSVIPSAVRSLRSVIYVMPT